MPRGRQEGSWDSRDRSAFAKGNCCADYANEAEAGETAVLNKSSNPICPLSQQNPNSFCSSRTKNSSGTVGARRTQTNELGFAGDSLGPQSVPFLTIPRYRIDNRSPSSMLSDKQIAALAKKNAAKAQQISKKRQQKFDATLDATRPTNEDETGETQRLFDEMKKREF